MPTSYPIQQISHDIESDADGLDPATYVDFVLDNRWLIIGSSIIAVLLGLAYLLISRPIYETNILIQVEEPLPASKSTLNDVSAPYDVKATATSEMEILRSRMVVAHAVDQAQLYIEAQPRYFPVIGRLIAKYNKKLSDPGLFGYGGYAWGAERVELEHFRIPEELEGKTFNLIAENNNRFRLSQPDNGISFHGKLGENTSTVTQFGEIEIRVNLLAAKSGAQFRVIRYARLDTIEKLQSALKISEKGKQSGVIGIALEGPDPKAGTRALNAIGEAYLRQNIERKSAEAEKSLAFLNKQLPELKLEVERSEERYNNLRNKQGTFDLGEEAKVAVHQSALFQTKMIELQQKKAELLRRYQDEHPAVQSVNTEIRDLNKQIEKINSKTRQLPQTEQEVLRLARDLKVNTELYTALLGTAQQLRVAAASKVGNARLLDAATAPTRPVKPKSQVVLAMAGVIGLAFGTMFAFLRKNHNRRIDDPREIELALGLTVAAAIPHSIVQEKMQEKLERKDSTPSVLTLPDDALDSTIESLRGFRGPLQLALNNSKNNIVMITSPAPAAGKSFISANLAAVLASFGDKVLLIDGDLRTGHLHRYFRVGRQNGLTDAIANTEALPQLVRKNVVPNLDFISAGSSSRKPGNFLAHKDFSWLLQQLSEQYDCILIDSAPVLSVSDGLIIAPHVGSIFNVVRSGANTIEEIEEAVTRFNKVGIAVTGIIFNDLKPRFSRYGYGGYYTESDVEPFLRPVRKILPKLSDGSTP